MHDADSHRPCQTQDSPSPGGPAAPAGSRALSAIERELLHSAIRRALRHMMDGTQDPATFLAEVREELAAVLGGREPEGQAFLLAEFEAVLRCLRAEAPRPAPAPPGGGGCSAS